jgi:V-type H+-transporting ATPase subunit E
MIKLMEPSLKIVTSEKDRELIKKILKESEKEYEQLMLKETGREFKCALEVEETKSLNPENDCGGVILISTDGRIVCNSTVTSKLGLAYEQLLPEIRALLFPHK